MRDLWAMPRTALKNEDLTVQAVKLAEEAGEVMEAVLTLHTSINARKRRGRTAGQMAEDLAGECFDVIQVACSLLAALDDHGVNVAACHMRHLEKIADKEKALAGGSLNE